MIPEGAPSPPHEATPAGRARRPLPHSLVAPVREVRRRVARPRATPGSAVDDGPAQSAIVDCALYSDGRRTGGPVPLAVALESAQRTEGRGFVWIGLHEPSAAEFDEVSAEFGLHPLAVEDAVHAHQRPKIEVYGDSLFVVLKTVRYVDPTEAVEIGELMLFLGRDFVVTVRHGGASALSDVRRELEARPELLEHGPSAVLYAVADRVVDDYAAAADGIANDIDEIELEVFSDGLHDPTQRLYKLKREVMEFRRAVSPLAAPLARITAGELPLVDPATHHYFRDVYDHVVRTREQIESYDELLSSAVAANLAQVQTRDNQDMRKITAWAAILTTNTLIAGIYGMNFTHMPELGWRFGYPLVLAVMVVIAVLLYRGFKRNHWL